MLSHNYSDLVLYSLVEEGFSLFLVMGAGLAAGKGFIMINRRIFPVSEFAGPETVSFLGNDSRQLFCLLIWVFPCFLIFSLSQIVIAIFLSLLLRFGVAFVQNSTLVVLQVTF